MMRNQESITLYLILTAGSVLRFVPGFQTDFPLNDGGMFLSMIHDLQTSHYALPIDTSYNLSQIPFAYPPFGMYLAAILSGLFHISEITLLIWLPALASAAIVPVFYWVSLQLFREKNKPLLAVMLVSFLPGSFDWLVMGGGLTRSFGILFFLLAVGFVLKTFRDYSAKSAWFSILFCSLSVLSHPEVALQTVGICFVLWLVFGMDRAGIWTVLKISLGTALLTAPWWGNVLVQHGVSPFVSAMQTGIREKLLASLFHSFFSTQGGLPLIPILSLLGLYATLLKKEPFFAAWAFVPFLLDPRNAPAISAYAYVLLSVEGLWLLKEKFMEAASQISKASVHYMPTFVFIVLSLFLFWTTFTSASNFGNVRLKNADRESMQWIRDNLPADAQFLLLTNNGQISPMIDAYQEWFPALTERHSLNTLQGLEWTLGPAFYEYSLSLMDLQTCADTDCLNHWVDAHNISVDFILVRPGRVSPKLVESLQASESYRVIYQTDAVLLYENTADR